MAADTQQNRLRWLDEAAREGREVCWPSSREIWIFDAETARALLRNDDGRMVEHSDFFANGRRTPSRDLQIAIAREAHALIHSHVQKVDCRRFVSALDRRSEWPRAGNALLFEIMRPILAGPWRSQNFQHALERMITARIFSRHESSVGALRRISDRFRFYRAVVAELSKPGECPEAKPDLIQLFRTYRNELDEMVLVQLYAGFVFATVGSIGFALGWAVLQAIRNRKTEHHPAHIVLEALRLFPVAWLFHRHVRSPTVVLGERILPKQTVALSPYAIHRNPRYWSEPTAFLPERWSTSADRSAWLPFGAGEHACVAAGLSMRLASELLSEILRCDPEIALGDGPPSLGAALAPPRFVLNLCGSN